MTRQISRQINVYSHLQKSGNMPTIPEVLLKILDLCDETTTPLDEIAVLIGYDPALSFKVMQLANSSYFRGQTKFTGISYAVDYLGLKSVKNICLTTSIHQVFERKRLKKVSQFSICNFWYHSLLSAILAKRIAKKTGYQNIEEAYLAGLIHDIGRLVLVTAFPREHEAILLETENKQNVLWAEEQLLGITHTGAGAWLVENWQVDSLLVDAIKYHHESVSQVCEAFPLVKVVYLSNLLSDAMQNNDLIEEAGKHLFRLNRADLDTILGGAIADVNTIAESLGVQVEITDTAQSAEGEGSFNNLTEKDELETTAAGSSLSKVYSVSSNIKNQVALINRVKNTSLLSGFMEKFVLAGDIEEIISSFEQSVNILFNLEEVILFLPDNSELFLEGRASTTNSLNKKTHGLALPIQRSSSAIVKAFNTSQILYLRKNEGDENLADNQILQMVSSNTLLLLPMSAHGKTIGVVLLALPNSVKELPSSDLKILNVLSQQVGLNLHLEQTKAEQVDKIEAERIAAVSMTAKKVAHEINNPLGIINNYLKAMSIKFGENTELQQELGIIGEEIDRISKMVNQMGLLSPSENLKIELLDVNDAISNIIRLVKTSLFNGEGKQLLFHPGTNLPQIKCSQDGLRQIVVNLLKNAYEAIPGEGRVTVSTRAILKQQQLGVSAGVCGIEISIKDSGPGLPEMVQANLFKPFVTTKKSGHSGLGLSIVHKIVAELKGTITCSSNAKDGTVFRMFFPVV